MADRSPAEFFAEKYKHGPEEATEAEMATEWNRLRDVQEDRGFKPGWVSYQFKELFDEWPPRDGYLPSQGGGDRPGSKRPETRAKPQQKKDTGGDHGYGPPPQDEEPKHCPHCGGVL